MSLIQLHGLKSKAANALGCVVLSVRGLESEFGFPLKLRVKHFAGRACRGVASHVGKNISSPQHLDSTPPHPEAAHKRKNDQNKMETASAPLARMSAAVEPTD